MIFFGKRKMMLRCNSVLRTGYCLHVPPGLKLGKQASFFEFCNRMLRCKN
jgi:hypothetical protein